jgi:aspartate kinase
MSEVVNAAREATELVVLKFGGTSLASPLRVRRAAARVHAHLRRGRRVVAVVSAAGHETDMILARIGAVAERWQVDAEPSSPPQRQDGVRKERPAHPALPAEPLPPLPGEVDRAARREMDRLLAMGEDRSAGLLALALCDRGVPARSLHGGEAGIRAVGAFGSGSIEEVRATGLQLLLADGIVPVVSGFQGERDDGETMTLGRGGSDISAVAIAAALGATACHIVTDVPAVYDGDPRTSPGARPFATLEHAELVALTESGAEVVHPVAARMAAARRVALQVYDYRAPWNGGGTRIGDPRDHAADRSGEPRGASFTAIVPATLGGAGAGGVVNRLAEGGTARDGVGEAVAIEAVLDISELLEAR